MCNTLKDCSVSITIFSPKLKKKKNICCHNFYVNFLVKLLVSVQHIFYGILNAQFIIRVMRAPQRDISIVCQMVYAMLTLKIVADMASKSWTNARLPQILYMCCIYVNATPQNELSLMPVNDLTLIKLKNVKCFAISDFKSAHSKKSKLREWCVHICTAIWTHKW